jgi:hypothetical protein
MCFEFGCFGGGRREDYGGERPARKEQHGRGRRGNHGNGAHYSGAADHKEPPAAHHNQPHAAAFDEAAYKAYHDGARKEHHHAAAGGHGGYLYDKAEYDTPKLPAWHNQVDNNAGYTYPYTARLHEAAADHRENAAMDYHHFPTTTTNTTLVRY